MQFSPFAASHTPLPHRAPLLTQSAGQLVHVSDASHTPFVHSERSILQAAVQTGVPAQPPQVAPARFPPSHSSPGSTTPLPQAVDRVDTVTRAAVASWLVCVMVKPFAGSENVCPSASTRTRSVFVLGRVWMLVLSA